MARRPQPLPSTSAPERPPPPEEVLAGSVGFLLSKLGSHTAAQFTAALEPLGIDPGQFALLRIVAASEGASQQTLVSALQVPASRMVGVIDNLEDLGLVERRRNPRDRRANALHLTGDGTRMLHRAHEVAVALENRLCASIDAGERHDLLALLRRLAEGQDLPVGVHPGLARRSQ